MLGCTVKNCDKDTLLEHGLEAVQPGVYAKFQQNEILQKLVSTTKLRTIAEAMRDTI